MRLVTSLPSSPTIVLVNALFMPNGELLFSDGVGKSVLLGWYSADTELPTIFLHEDSDALPYSSAPGNV